MRFNKKNRKLRPQKGARNPAGGLSFWLMLAGGVVLMGFFLFLMYGGQETKLRRIQEEKILSDMDRICVALVLFLQEHGRYPDSREGLEALAENAGAEGNVPGENRIGMLQQIPLDPWRNPYRYQEPQGASLLRLVSLGADGRPGGSGDASDVVREGCRSAALPGE